MPERAVSPPEAVREARHDGQHRRECRYSIHIRGHVSASKNAMCSDYTAISLDLPLVLHRRASCTCSSSALRACLKTRRFQSAFFFNENLYVVPQPFTHWGCVTPLT